MELLKNGVVEFSPPEIISKDGKEVALYNPKEKHILQAFYLLLSDEVDKKFSKSCIGGRKGFSRHDFMAFLSIARSEKLHWVVKTDVSNFFANISHSKLDNIIRSRFRIPRDIRRLLLKLLSLGIDKNEPKGIFCGNPLDCLKNIKTRA